MSAARIACSVLLAIMICVAPVRVAHAQDNPAVTHAKQVFELLRQEKVDDIVKQFNAQMSAALSATQLSEVWSKARGQLGSFQSILDDKVAAQGVATVVTLGAQFEHAAINVVVAFDGENKIAGLVLTPRQ